MTFTNDIEGKKYFTEFLTNKGFTNICETSNYCSWDIEAEKNNQKYYFELKVRPRLCMDGRWNDTICELHKIQSSPDIHHSFIVNLFTDCFTCIPFTTPYEIQRKRCQKTNNWDHTKVVKDLVSWKNEPKYIRQYV